MARPILNTCIIGAGTMGAGIALVAAQNGFPTILFDINAEVLDKARHSIYKNVDTLLEKKRLLPEEALLLRQRLLFTGDLNHCKADVVIEAIVEKPAAKISIFRQLADINRPDTIFASNTSSLSISALQKEIPLPARVAGMHFFNPAHLMKLVEVISGDQTDRRVAESLFQLAMQMGKTPVMCKDSPGFIVNRVARHYYLESMKLVELGLSSPEQVDNILEASGFKLGPFRLMDLIGMDINLAVSQSLYEAFDHVERLKPSALQEEKVARGELGKKTGKGFYNYQ